MPPAPACVSLGLRYLKAKVFGDAATQANTGVPLEFWKVVVMIGSSKDKLHATAYLLSQGQPIRRLLEDGRSEAIEGLVLGPYRTFQISIADLEKATQYDFGRLKDADPLKRARGSRETAAANVPIIVPIETSRDLVLWRQSVRTSPSAMRGQRRSHLYHRKTRARRNI